MTSKRSRPLGVAAIGWIIVVAGVVAALAGCAPEAAPAGPALVLGGVAGVALGDGLLKRQRWARVTVIVLCIVISAAGLVERNTIAALVSVLLIAYLLSPKVNDAFAALTADGREAPASIAGECLAQS
jgi:hypothetical protein